MELIRIFLAIISVTIIGFNVLYCVSGKGLRLRAPEAIAVSFGLGFGALSLEMLIFYLLNLAFNVLFLLAPWLGLVALNLWLYTKRGRRIIEPSRLVGEASKRRGPLELFLAGAIGFEVVYAIFRALIKPIESYDAIAIYAIKSKIFYLARAIPQDYFGGLVNLFPHPDYPLNIPLSQAFLYLSMGNINDQLVKLIFPLFFAAILVLFYYALRRVSGRQYALVCTFILAGIPQFNNYATNAYLEVPLAFYCFGGFLFLMRWIEDTSDIGCLVVSAVLTALAGWTKNEGLLYCVIYTALIVLSLAVKAAKTSRKDILYAAIYPCIILLISLPWLLIKARFHIVNSEIDLANLNPVNLVGQIGKLGPVFYELQKQVFGPKKWNILWPALMVILAFNYRRIFKAPQFYMLAAVVLALAGYILFYMISYVDVVFFASKTWSRFLLDFLPVAVYLLAVLLKEDVNGILKS